MFFIIATGHFHRRERRNCAHGTPKTKWNTMDHAPTLISMWHQKAPFPVDALRPTLLIATKFDSIDFIGACQRMAQYILLGTIGFSIHSSMKIRTEATPRLANVARNKSSISSRAVLLPFWSTNSVLVGSCKGVVYVSIYVCVHWLHPTTGIEQPDVTFEEAHNCMHAVYAW